MELNVERATEITLATVVLHNLIMSMEKVDVNDYVDWNEPRYANQQNQFRGRPAAYPTWIREQLKSYVNGVGAVSWQVDNGEWSIVLKVAL